jgi:hypothetical protein
VLLLLLAMWCTVLRLAMAWRRCTVVLGRRRAIVCRRRIHHRRSRQLLARFLHMQRMFK